MADDEGLPEQNFVDWFNSEFDNALSDSLHVVGGLPDPDHGDAVQLSVFANLVEAVPEVLRHTKKKCRAFGRLRWYVLKLLGRVENQILLAAGPGAFARIRSDLQRLFGLYTSDPESNRQGYRQPDEKAFKDSAALLREWCASTDIDRRSGERPPVTLRGRGRPAVVQGQELHLSDSQYDVVQTLFDVYPRRLTKDELATKSGRPDARGILTRLIEGDERDLWRQAIGMAGTTHGGYGLVRPT